MAKVVILGNAAVVTSSLKLEDIKTVKKYRPDALVLKGGDDGKEPIFALGTGASSINEFGVSFDQETRDDDKFATMTLVFDYDGDDVVEYMADRLGAAIVNLTKIEAFIPTVLDEIKAERDTVINNIRIDG